MKKILSYMFILLTLMACGDDTNPQSKETFDINVIDGEWYCLDENSNSYAEEMKINTFDHSIKIYSYINPSKEAEVMDSISGNWTFFEDSKSIRFNAHSDIYGSIYTMEYEIMESDNNSLTFRNKATNVNYKYWKVVEKHYCNIGETFNINYFSSGNIKPETVKSVNENIATVNSDGSVMGISGGTTYVVAKSDSKIVAVKIVVNSGVEQHISEIDTNFDGIIAKYGIATKVEELADGVITAQYLNPTSDPNAVAVSFSYDKSTNQVFRILVIYDSMLKLSYVENEIKSKFYLDKTLGDFTSYNEKETLMASKCFFYVHKSEPCVFFSSAQYYLNH